ncbi:hypothetical protein PIB30_004043 [Stylosanthes scabra]|uniref:DUF4283 domain-containing protein n=1 Tax=Stylosanthes scabra TaxID=79078 RepID=A0ABU6Y1P2_9FABA|nr:hypothetical protein [Stylosanthes scabra]
MGKLITDKDINPTWVQNAMSNIWRKPGGFQMKEIHDKLYQFIFKKEADMKRVLNGSPWLFRNSWLLLRRWERNNKPEAMDFSKDLFCIVDRAPEFETILIREPWIASDFDRSAISDSPHSHQF